MRSCAQDTRCDGFLQAFLRSDFLKVDSGCIGLCGGVGCVCLEGTEGLVVFVVLWGSAPCPARERGSLDPVFGGTSVGFSGR